MASNLVDLIFNQFADMVVDRAETKDRCEISQCDLSYRLRVISGHKIIDVLYKLYDDCGRVRDVITNIDITNICYEDLCTERWLKYLEKIARAFVVDICPKKLGLVCGVRNTCREQPPKWEPFKTRTTTYINRIKPHEPKITKPQVIVEDECECIETCQREPCSPEEKVVIRYKNEPSFECGNCTRLVDDKPKYKEFKDVVDHNSHAWKSDCGNCRETGIGVGIPSALGSNEYYKTTVHS